MSDRIDLNKLSSRDLSVLLERVRADAAASGWLKQAQPMLAEIKAALERALRREGHMNPRRPRRNLAHGYSVFRSPAGGWFVQFTGAAQMYGPFRSSEEAQHWAWTGRRGVQNPLTPVEAARYLSRGRQYLGAAYRQVRGPARQSMLGQAVAYGRVVGEAGPRALRYLAGDVVRGASTLAKANPVDNWHRRHPSSPAWKRCDSPGCSVEARHSTRVQDEFGSRWRLCSRHYREWEEGPEDPTARRGRKNPLMAVVGNPGRRARPNRSTVAAGTTRDHVTVRPKLPANRVRGHISLDEAIRRNVPGIREAVKRFVKFHGVKPSGEVTIYDDGRKDQQAAFLIGRAPQVAYDDVPPGSNKEGNPWIHKTSKNLPTYLVHLPQTGDNMLIGHMVVGTWLRERDDTDRRH